MKINKPQKHNIEIVIDRLIVKDGITSRLTDSVQMALQKGEGLLYVDNNGIITMFSEKASCPECNLSFDEITPRIFSFNAPYGACPTCGGLGAHYQINPDLLIPDDTKSHIASEAKRQLAEDLQNSGGNNTLLDTATVMDQVSNIKNQQNNTDLNNNGKSAKINIEISMFFRCLPHL